MGMIMENKLVKSLAVFLDKSEKEIDDLVVTMDFKDLAKVSNALRNSDEKEVLKILHGYGL